MTHFLLRMNIFKLLAFDFWDVLVAVQKDFTSLLLLLDLREHIENIKIHVCGGHLVISLIKLTIAPSVDLCDELDRKLVESCIGPEGVWFNSLQV